VGISVWFLILFWFVGQVYVQVEVCSVWPFPRFCGSLVQQLTARRQKPPHTLRNTRPTTNQTNKPHLHTTSTHTPLPNRLWLDAVEWILCLVCCRLYRFGPTAAALAPATTWTTPKVRPPTRTTRPSRPPLVMCVLCILVEFVRLVVDVFFFFFFAGTSS